MVPDILMEEIAGLQKAGYQIQHELVGQRIYIVFKDFVLPPGHFNRNTTDLMVWTTTHYPETAFDMFWTSEDLLLHSNQPPKNAGVFERHLNRNWRRFSIHPYSHTPWIPLEDNIGTYLIYINQRLSQKI